MNANEQVPGTLSVSRKNNEQDVGIELFVYQFRNQSTETDDRE